MADSSRKRLRGLGLVMAVPMMLGGLLAAPASAQVATWTCEYSIVSEPAPGQVARVDMTAPGSIVLTTTENQLLINGTPCDTETAATNITFVVALGTSGADTIDASALSNFTWLRGRGGNDTLIGGSGADVLDGMGGSDTLAGNAGDDSLAGGTGSDALDGGAGRDLADYLDSNAGVVVNLGTNTATGGHATGDTIANIEDVYGSELNDSLTGSADDNYLYGDDGNDTLVGGAGNDELEGGEGNDTEIGDEGADVFFQGFFPEGADDLNGGDGLDIVDYSEREDEVSVTLDDVADDGDVNTNESDNARSDIEDFRLPQPGTQPKVCEDTANRLCGTNEADELTITDGEVVGGCGDDVINVNTGADTTDVVVNDDCGDNTVNLNVAPVVGGQSISVVVNLGNGSDQVNLNLACTKRVSVNIRTGAGPDEVKYPRGACNSNVIVNLGGGHDLAHATPEMGGANRGRGFRVLGRGGKDQIFGGGRADVLLGHGGADTIVGRGGNDTIKGGAANDSLFGSAGKDTIVGGGGKDTIRGHGGADTIRGSKGNDKMWGDSGHDKILGQGGNDFLNGGVGNDLLNGGRGTDTCRPGSGKDDIRKCER